MAVANSVRIGVSLEDKVSAGLDKIRGKLDTLGGKGVAASFFGNLGAAGVAAGVGLVKEALSGVVDQAFQSVQAASNLNEALSKSDAVFGDLSGEMKAWADTASESFGQSQRSALEAAGTYGNLFQAFGIGQQQAATMSKTLVELASDLASFNNTSVEDAVDALRSGLSGETEPLKRFGVALNDVRLKEEAMRLGLIKTTSGVLPQAIKTQAAYSLILKDTTLAQGDFDRTSDGLANTQKSLAAAVEDAQAKIGEKLLPVMLDLANFAKDDLIPAIEGISDGIDKIGQGGVDNSDPLVNFGNLLSDLGQRGEESKTAIGTFEESVMDLMDTVEASASDGLDLITFWDTYVRKTDEAAAATVQAAEAVQRSSDDIIEGLASRGDEYSEVAGEFAHALPTAVQGSVDDAVVIISRTPQDLADALRDNRDTWEDAIDDFNEAWDSKLSTQAEKNKILGFLQGDKLAKGLASADPVLRAQSVASRDAALSALQRMTGLTYDYGKNALVNLIKGMNSQLLNLDAASERAAGVISDNLRLRSPAKKGPLSQGGGPEGWGERFGILFGRGMDSGMPDIGAMVSGPSLGASSVAAPASFGGSRGGDTLNVTFQTLAVPSAAQRQELEDVLTPLVVSGFQKRRLLQKVGTF